MRYRLLLYLLAPLIWLALWWRGRREPGWRQGWRERLGGIEPRGDRPLWIHGASVGEVNSAAPLYRRLQQDHPHWPLHLTAFTPSGRERLRELVPGAHAGLLPLDFPGAAARYVERLSPRALIVLETECWPQLLLACHARGIPVIWLSARLQAGSLRGMQWLFGRRLLTRALAPVQAIGAQTPADVERFVALGAPRDRVSCTGSLKLDLNWPPTLPDQAAELRAQLGREMVWLAASTHAGEEEAALAAHAVLRERWPQALLLLAPRHPRRAGEVAALVERAGHGMVRRSDGALPAPGDAVLLIDTLGELMLFYAACDLAFVGGSLVPVGGHNLLEPAALGRAVLAGPQLASCRDLAAELEAAGALRIVSDAGEFSAAVSELLAAPERRRRMGEAGARYAEANRGALDRSRALIARVLD